MPTPVLDALRKFEAVAHTAIALAPQDIKDKPLAEKVMVAVANNPTIAVVPVETPWLSPTLWTQVLMAVAALLAIFGVALDPDLIPKLVGGVVALGSLYTIYRKFTSPTVTTTAVAEQKTEAAKIAGGI